MAEQVCPHCGKPQMPEDEDIGYTPRPPELGDISFCFACGEWSIFEADLSRRLPTAMELYEIGCDDRCTKLRTTWVSEHG